MPNTANDLTSLKTKLLEIQHLRDASALLSWDQETYMPSGGGQARADQIALLQTLAHDKFVSSDIETLLAPHIDPTTGLAHDETTALDDASKALLRETWRDFSRAKKLPSEFVTRLERECSLAQQVWAEARQENNFAKFLPKLQTIIELKHEEVGYLGYKDSPYNTLLDTYEPGATVAQLKPLFTTLREGLVSLLDQIQQAPTPPDNRILYQAYDNDHQMEFGKEVLTKMGYDFTRGRLDVSAHPFTTSFHPTDVRVTTRVFENDFQSCLFSCIHEGGHGLYEQGLSSEHHGTPLGEALSLGIHESQSRLWENSVGRSRAFWEHFFPVLKERFPDQLNSVTVDTFYSAINTVKPSLIRVEADEVTYNLHVMVRFEIELDVIEKRVSVKDLPELWRTKMKEYLGVVPEKESEGVLQDVHWSFGAFGYFPTYTLGNLYAAMLFKKAGEDLPSLNSDIAQGNLIPLKEWLNDRIHRHGRHYTSEKLIKNATGQTLSAEPFLQSLRTKMEEVYGITLTNS
ncbi:MAG: carboxypeptidase M32 [Nitrospirae bacterium]|nr:carboxypeptidase M32 [Nitrospirota bacterium]MDA1304750.1 carboxypeptidase M32 [Nitrospirota bacterium]